VSHQEVDNQECDQPSLNLKLVFLILNNSDLGVISIKINPVLCMNMKGKRAPNKLKIV